MRHIRPPCTVKNACSLVRNRRNDIQERPDVARAPLGLPNLQPVVKCRFYASDPVKGGFQSDLDRISTGFQSDLNRISVWRRRYRLRRRRRRRSCRRRLRSCRAQVNRGEGALGSSQAGFFGPAGRGARSSALASFQAPGRKLTGEIPWPC